ncbi:uncharacterized protein LOC126910031 [Daktulosphaira vitifoliae]|nr:uncharacterized protein LOC126910031 [Daktulosphaira vitifoliae]
MGMAGFTNNHPEDIFQLMRLQLGQPKWFKKVILTQIVVYICIFFSLLKIVGQAIKEPISKKVMVLGDTLVIIGCLMSSYFLLQIHKDFNKHELMVGSMSYAIIGLLFTCDAAIMSHQLIAKMRQRR